MIPVDVVSQVIERTREVTRREAATHAWDNSDEFSLDALKRR